MLDEFDSIETLELRKLLKELGTLAVDEVLNCLELVVFVK